MADASLKRNQQNWHFYSVVSLTILMGLAIASSVRSQPTDEMMNQVEASLNQVEASFNETIPAAGEPETTDVLQDNVTPVEDLNAVAPARTEDSSEPAKPDEGTTPPAPVEIDGDQVEFLTEENKVIAQGNVVVTNGEVKLFADRIEVDRNTNVAVAEGHVILMQGKSQMIGDRLKFDYKSMAGEFDNAKVDSHPFYGTGSKVSKVGDNHILMKDGHLTTCDHDKPHWQIVSRKIDIYPKDKAVARNVRLLAGKVPLLYLPRYTQNISDKKPRVIFTPGYDKDWGAFLLQQWRYYFSEDFKGIVHLDYRERKDFAWGVDLNYKTRKYGTGIIRTYYMNERSLNKKLHFWEERLNPTPERERFRGEWRHKWDIDEATSTIWQYSKLSDSEFLEDYFKRQKQEDSASPVTYFLLTRTLPMGVLSFRNDKRVNRFDSMTERLPEIRYDLPTRELGHSNFYLQNLSTFSNLSTKTAAPSDDRKETKRVHMDNTVSYPMKVSFMEVRPFAGGSQTYYSKTSKISQYDVMRGIFRTGADLSTKFYRLFDVNTNAFGLDINRLRHVITPTVAYEYRHDPTRPPALLDQFDSIDALDRGHGMIFGIENKVQTKRKGQSVDLLRALVSTDFRLKEDKAKGGFNSISADIEAVPYDWMRADMDANYDTLTRNMKSINTDLNFFGTGDPFYVSFSHRWNGREDNDFITELGYKINQKWSFVIDTQHNLDDGTLVIQEYSLRRDLHDWLMQVNFNQTRGEGSEIWLVFTLKAFPEMGFDFGTGFNKRKAGSQLSE